MLVAVAKNEEELHLLRSVGYRSIMVVPLQTHDRVLGAISFVATENQRRFTSRPAHGRGSGAPPPQPLKVRNSINHYSSARPNCASENHCATFEPDLAAFVGVMTP
ncbi:MAG: hypothetical protein R2932_51655 [Caldilineaceae bacterium]